MKKQALEWTTALEGHLPFTLHWVFYVTAAAVFALVAIAEAVEALDE